MIMNAFIHSYGSCFLAVEKDLERLCYIPFGIKQLTITPEGGTFVLGSGDAEVQVPAGAVKMDIVVHYAIILHGPFVFSAGYKPGSVVIYLNMNGATLWKPVELLLSHWCIKEEDDEETLKFVRASHTLEAGQKQYIFMEQNEAVFKPCSTLATLNILEPQCLYCVQKKVKTVARYSALVFSKYDASEEILHFRTQLMCDSLEWIQVRRMHCQC